MELPLGGPALRHYTQSRPRPHRQKLNYRPSRPQETIIESENEVLELMGRVDEGVEEFFTKKVLPTEIQAKQEEESVTLQEVAPASSVPCPPPTKTLRRKLGDFFTLKKKRGLKSEPSQEGRPKKASIADLIRPLREVARSEKDKDRVKEHDKENEKEKTKGRPGAVTGESAVQEAPVTGDAPLRGEAVPPRRALREGKSQSLILLSGSAAAGTTNARNTAKKPLEGQHSFEQKLHLMLQRIGVSKPQQGETQNQEGEMKKAESEGTIIDSKPEPPSAFSKPRTMSASSDTRHQIRASVSAHEAAGKPALLPKPVIKPGPPPTTSGRNTPENELAQIQETETQTPTKLSPTKAPSAPSAPAAPDSTVATVSSVPTISNSVPDSASVTVSPSSTASLSDTEICTDSVNPTESAKTPTDSPGSDSKGSVPKASTPSTETHTSTFLTTRPSTTAPTEVPTTVPVLPTSSESITPVSETVTTSITTLETGSNKQSSVSTTSLSLLPKAALSEPDDALSADTAPGAGADADISATATASSSSTSTSDSGLYTTISSDTEAGETTSVASSIFVTLIPKTTSYPSASSDTVTAGDSHDVPISTSSTVVLSAPPPSASTASTTDKTISPTSSEHMSSATSSIQSVTLSPADMSVSSTSSSDTKPTNTTFTATSLNRADVTSTSSSANTAAISSPCITGSDPIVRKPSDESSATSHHLASPEPSDSGLCQDNDLQASSEEGVENSVKAAKNGTAVVEVVHQSESAELDEKKEIDQSDKKSKSDNDKPGIEKSDVMRKEVKEESVEAEEDTPSEPALGKEGEERRDDAVTEAQEQEETSSVGEK